MARKTRLEVLHEEAEKRVLRCTRLLKQAQENLLRAEADEREAYSALTRVRLITELKAEGTADARAEP